MMGKEEITFAKEYSCFHLITAICAGTVIFLGTTLLFAWTANEQDMVDTALVGGSIAVVVVGLFYAIPFFLGRKTASLLDLPKTDKKLAMFSFAGIVGVVISPVLFPTGSLSVGSANITALTVVGTAAFMIMPVCGAFHLTLLLIARHIRPVKNV
jgi:hypothetical protein